MNIYLDESYNFQKSRGKLCITINGFAVLDDKRLRKRWKKLRKPYVGRRRIHATDSRFEPLREKSIRFLGRHDLTILSVFQATQEIPYSYFDGAGLEFDKVYAELVKRILTALSLHEYRTVRVVIDARKHKGGILGLSQFFQSIGEFLQEAFPKTICTLQLTPSSMDVLLELADFVSNTFYREYQKDSDHVFEKLGFRLIQLKNPLEKRTLE